METTMNAPLLELKNVTVLHRIEAVNWAVESGQVVGLVGPNGSGKSTLIQAAAGVLPASGAVRWQGRPLRKIAAMERGRLVAWVPQDGRFEFGFSVRSVVGQGRYAHGDDGAGVEEALARLELQELAERPVSQLSGGERQRVLLARALATGAPLQLWDEPLAPLDPRHALQILQLARELAQRKNAAVVFSLHDLSLARELDAVVVLERGKLRAAGKPVEVLTPALLLDVFGVRAQTTERLTLKLP